MRRAARASVGAAALLCLAACRVQEGGPPAGEHQEANEWFLGWPALVFVALPIVLMAVLAIRRAKTRPSTLPRFDDETFESGVLEAQMPVLLHFSRDWSVPNRAALAQTELLAWQNRGAVVVGLLDVETCPKVMARFPGLEPPAYLLFYRGKKLFHRPGLRQAGDLQEEIDVALSREGF